MRILFHFLVGDVVELVAAVEKLRFSIQIKNIILQTRFNHALLDLRSNCTGIFVDY